MTYKTKTSPAAKEDIRKAAKWYKKAKPGLGIEFTTRIRQRVADLLENPRVCQIRYKEVHTAVVRQFPFMIHYTVNQQTKTIEIIAVLSTHRDPKLWDERSK
jgi:plasmid stabilization system protein ParE